MQVFGDWLHEQRTSRNWSQSDLSRASTVDSSIITRWETGATRPSPANLAKIAPALGVPYEDLLKMCGYLPGEPDPELDPKRQAMHAQLDRWLNDVRPEDEDPFLTALKAHGDSTVALINRMGTAVNAAAIAPLSTGVNTRNPARTTPRRGTGRQLRPAQRCAKPQLTPRIPHPGYPQTPLRPPLYRLTPLHS
jgi:transcriptional regulator with XRE-family HTH domain